MIAWIVVSLLLQQQGPKAIDVDPNKVQAPVVVPAGTVIPIRLTSGVSTKNSHDGDGIYGRTAFPITVDNKVVIPEGAFVKGKISEIRRPGRVKGKAELSLNFQTLIMPSGATIPIYTSLRGTGEAGERRGEATIEGDSSKTEDAKTVGTIGATGAGIGAISDRSAKGAAIGGASGAAIGAATVLLTRGKDLEIRPGTTIEIVLDRPLEP
jgi:type IV secretion system protein VirB10